MPSHDTGQHRSVSRRESEPMGSPYAWYLLVTIRFVLLRAVMIDHPYTRYVVYGPCTVIYWSCDQVQLGPLTGAQCDLYIGRTAEFWMLHVWFSTSGSLIEVS
jgi:hypothetical protein